MQLMLVIFFFLIIRPPPISTRTDPLLPYTTLVRSIEVPSRRRSICSGNPLSKIRSTLGPSAVDRCRPTRRRPNDDRRFKDDSRRPVLGYAQRGDGKGRTAHLPLSWTQDDDYARRGP